MIPALEVTHLVKNFAALPVLRDVNFEVARGALVAILGASGSGKSTLLRLIAGFERPDGGEIRLDGALVASGEEFQKPELRGVGYVAQDGALFPHLCVADNITFGLARAARRARHRVKELLQLVGLPAHYADRAPQALSGGEQSRVALARALAPNPRLVLLDEPFSALDAGLREETRNAVAAALKEAGATSILVTHDQAEALSMGARVGVLRRGRLCPLEAPQALYRRPQDAALADFLGEAVFVPGDAAAGTVRCALGSLPCETNAAGPVAAMIRPEQIKLLPAEAPDGVAAIVTKTVFCGHDAMVSLSVNDGGSNLQVTARVFSLALPTPGSIVRLKVEGEVVAYPPPLSPLAQTDAAG